MSETSETLRPAPRKALAVPPVLMSSTLNSLTRAEAKSKSPVLSETDRRARRTGTRSSDMRRPSIDGRSGVIDKFAVGAGLEDGLERNEQAVAGGTIDQGAFGLGRQKSDVVALGAEGDLSGLFVNGGEAAEMAVTAKGDVKVLLVLGEHANAAGEGPAGIVQRRRNGFLVSDRHFVGFVECDQSGGGDVLIDAAVGHLRTGHEGLAGEILPEQFAIIFVQGENHSRAGGAVAILAVDGDAGIDLALGVEGVVGEEGPV